MAKQIIILDIGSNPSQSLVSVHYLLWLTTANPVAKAGAVSQWLGASVAENAAIAAGTTIEESYTILLPIGLTKAQAEALLNLHYTARQNEFGSQPQPGVLFGIFFDSVTGWSA